MGSASKLLLCLCIVSPLTVGAEAPLPVPAPAVSEVPTVSTEVTPADWGEAPPPPYQAYEIKDPSPLPRTVDLTASPDDIWQRIRNGFMIPDLDTPLVLDRQKSYAANPEYLKRVVERSRRYLYHIVEEIEKRGMPTEIALLPMVESAFNPMAYSRAHASGLWQFIPSTGKNYKLQQNWWFDSRRDIVASTDAALDYLQFLYEMHGDWYLALASYNWGENGVSRAIQKNKAKGLPTDYLSLPMPRETRYYLPKLQALKNIIAHPEAFGMQLDPIPNEPYFVAVPTTQDIDIRLAAELAEMPVDELIALNPAYNRPVISGAQTLVLPADRVETFQANLESHDKPLVSWQSYTLKSGDRLDRLAVHHGITLARLKLVNGITPRTRVSPGHQLILPIKGTKAGVEPLPAVFRPPVLPEPRGRKIVHIVKSGETLFAIARRYRVRVEDLRVWNRIDNLMAGQRLVIRSRAAPKTYSTARTRAKVAIPRSG